MTALSDLSVAKAAKPPRPASRKAKAKPEAKDASLLGAIMASLDDAKAEEVIALDLNGHLWVRPHAMFFEEIEADGRRQPRFTPVAD